MILTEEQKSKLSRDYEKNPLKRGERIVEQDLRYTYLYLNLTDEDLKDVFHKSKFYIQQCRYFYKIYKTKEQIQQKRCKTNLQKYGCKTLFEDKIVREQIKQTIKQKYDVNNVMQNEKIKEKFRQTSLQKYGTEHPFQNKNVQQKYKETCENNNGCEWNLQCLNIQQKIKQTNLEKYGVCNVMKNKDIQQKHKQTCLQRYGVDNYTKSNLYNGKQTTYKAYETKKKNKTINISKQEKLVYDKLIFKFPNLQYQYRCEKYPFLCDFYIPILDLFMECNFHWTHGNEPFNENNIQHQKILQKWKEKTIISKFYQNAVDVWTIKDPLKRQTAKDNNLNWIEFFTFKEFENWYNQRKES